MSPAPAPAARFPDKLRIRASRSYVTRRGASAARLRALRAARAGSDDACDALVATDDLGDYGARPNSRRGALLVAHPPPSPQSRR